MDYILKDRLKLCGLIAIIVAAIIGISFLVAAGATYLACVTYADQKYDVTVVVQAVEQSTRFADHTNVWVQVYGDQDITYTFSGLHDFTVGEKYRIVFVDQPKLLWYVCWWYENWGEVQSVTLL